MKHKVDRCQCCGDETFNVLKRNLLIDKWQAPGITHECAPLGNNDSLTGVCIWLV